MTLHEPLNLDEVIEALGTVLPAMETNPVNMAIWADYHDQAREILLDHKTKIFNWLKELRELKGRHER